MQKLIRIVENHCQPFIILESVEQSSGKPNRLIKIFNRMSSKMMNNNASLKAEMTALVQERMRTVSFAPNKIRIFR